MSPSPESVEQAVAALADEARPVVLAVSGGLDSMVLLHAAARAPGVRLAAVATFDHRSGPASARAVARVAAAARALGLACVAGRARERESTEAGWRAARWRFLHGVAAGAGAVVATAHTEDDQAETVFMRLLRGSGVRGLAGLLAASPVRRPLVRLTRGALAAYAARHRVRWVDDPTNASRRHLRNRVRLDLLPAVERASPGFRDWLLDLGERSAALRADVERLVSTLGVGTEPSGGVRVAAAALAGYDAEGLGLLWPVIVARYGVALDRRGTRRLAEFTSVAVPGTRIQLSGGYEVLRRRDTFEVRRTSPPGTGALVPLVGEVGFGGWRFRPVGELAAGAWTAELPGDRVLEVRAWQAGDRIRVAPGRPPRRVARFFADLGIGGMDRAGWPVVLAAGEIVWIPGVRRSDAAAVRSGRPLRYLCERDSSRSTP